MVVCFESSIRRLQIYNFMKNSSVIGHCIISRMFKSSFVESLAFNFEFVSITIIAAIRLAEQAEHFISVQRNSSLNNQGSHLSSF